jgi:hypothetical protein
MTNAEIQVSVNEYVRTKKHGIFKVTKLYEVEDKYYILNNDKDETYTIGGNPRFDISKDIVNHSFNLIDLIEVGDYVNGYLIMEDEGKLKRGNAYVVFKRNEHSYLEIWAEEDIKTIVTHEQFENMEYKVGGDND